MPEYKVYDASMGYVEYEGETVVIAGRPRPHIVYCDAGVEAAYRHCDAVEESRTRQQASVHAFSDREGAHA